MASVTWALASVDFDIDDGFCHTAHWTVTRVDGDYSASSYGSQSLKTEDIKDFVPFDEVTSEMVDGWVKDAMGEETVTSIEESLDQQIEDQKNPTSETIILDN